MDYSKTKSKSLGGKGPMSLDPNNRNQRKLPHGAGKVKPVIKPVTGKPSNKV